MTPAMLRVVNVNKSKALKDSQDRAPISSVLGLGQERSQLQIC